MIHWDAVSAIVSGLALLVNVGLAYSVVIAVRGVRETEKAKESGIFIWSLDRVREIRPTMNEIKLHARDLPWLRENSNEVLKVLEIIQMITFMAEEGVINRERITGMWGKSIVEQWISLEPFILDFRTSIGEPESAAAGAFFARSFERLAVTTRAHLNENFTIDWSRLERPAVSNKREADCISSSSE